MTMQIETYSQPASSSKQQATNNEQQIIQSLEWAGTKSLSLLQPRPGPRKLQSSFPLPTLSFQPSTFNFHSLSPQEIDLIDKIYSFISLTPDPMIRRILHSRSLLNPITRKHIYSWAKLARVLGIERRKVKSLWEKGIKDIVSNLNPRELDQIRKQIP